MNDASATTEIDPAVERAERLSIAFIEALRRGKSRGEDVRGSPLCYPGLRSFEPHEGLIFFGRSTSLKDVQQRLGERRTLVVLGGSGSGKSSLIRAGILPFLNSKRPIGRRRGVWFWTEFRPRTSPLAELTLALHRILDGQLEEMTESNEKAARLKSAAKAVVRGFTEQKASCEERNDPHFAEFGPAPEDDARLRRAKLLSFRLLRFSHLLNAIDEALHGDYRSGATNLMLLIDQFEELFRPEVNANVRDEFLDFLVITHGRIEEAARRPDGPGLFIVLTMRSEELHRCAEHAPLPELPGVDVSRSLTDLVNKSFYLLRLLDPERDRADLREAMLKPVREVLRAYEFPESLEQDYPFAPGVIDWLLAGAQDIGRGTDHQPDQMPLLQHALRQLWLNALREWLQAPVLSRGAVPIIHRSHLFRGDEKHEKSRLPDCADLKACLEAAADLTADRAGRAAVPAGAQRGSEAAKEPLRKATLRAMFRSLARRDDRNNWSRRFATIERMTSFLAHDPDAAVLVESADREKAIWAAVGTFVDEGYLQRSEQAVDETGIQRPVQYDISHEALIRNWRQALDWLKDLENLTGALERAVDDLSPEKQAQAKGDWSYLMPERTAEDLAPLSEDGRRFPVEWACDEIVPMLARAETRRAWGLEDRGGKPPTEKDAQWVLDQITGVIERAERARRRKKRLWSVGYAAIAVLLIAVVYLEALKEGAKELEKTATEAANTGIVTQHIFAVTRDDSGRPPNFAQIATELLFDESLFGKIDGKLLNKTDVSAARQVWDGVLRWRFGKFLLGKRELNAELNQQIERQRQTLPFYCVTVGEMPASHKSATLVLAGKRHTVELAVAAETGLRTKASGGQAVWLRVDGQNQLGPEDDLWRRVVRPGDRVCLSENAQLAAWVDSDAITLAEITWGNGKNGVPMPYVDESTRAVEVSASSSGGEKNRAACVTGFFTAKTDVALVQGVGYGFSEFSGDQPRCFEAKDQKELFHFAGMRWPSNFPNNARFETIRCEPQSLSDKWQCGEGIEIEFARRGSTSFSVTGKSNGIAVPMIDMNNLKGVYIYGNEIVIESPQDTKYSILLPGPSLSKVLSSIAVDKGSKPTEFCRELVDCLEWFNSHVEK